MPRRASSRARKSLVSRIPRPETCWPWASVRVPGGRRMPGSARAMAVVHTTQRSQAQILRMGRLVANQGAEQADGPLEVVERDELVGGVGLGDVAGADHDGVL